MLFKLWILSTALVFPFSMAKLRTPRGPTQQNPSYRNSGHGLNESFTFEELFYLNRNFWDAFTFPEDGQQVKAINASIFAPDVVGRVDASRTFHGRQLNTEYVFGSFATLAGQNNTTTLLGVPTRKYLTHFAANKNIVSCAEVVWFDCKVISETLPVEIDAWFVYDSVGLIVEYDITFRWLEWTIDYIQQRFAQNTGQSHEKAKKDLETGIITQICKTASEYCIGPLQQYDSFGQCTTYLQTKVRFGKAYEFGMNTLLCRSLHELMVPLRPEVHCPHIGSQGGNMCVDDLTYMGKVTEAVFGLLPLIPYNFQNKNETIAAMR